MSIAFSFTLNSPLSLSFVFSERHDAWWTQFLAFSCIGRIGYVAQLVTSASWLFAQFARSLDVAVLPGLAQCVALVLADIAQLHCILTRRCLTQLFAFESELLAHFTAVCGSKSTLRLGYSQLQSTVDGLLPLDVRLLPDFAGLFANIAIPIESIVCRQWKQLVFAWQCVFAELVELFTKFAVVFTDVAIVFTIESLVLTDVALLFAHIAVVFADVTKLHACYAFIFTDFPQLFGFAALFACIAGLLTDGCQIFANITDIFAAIAIVRWLAWIAAIYAWLAAVLAGLTEILANIAAVLAQFAAALAVESVQSHRIHLLGDQSTLLAEHVDLFAEQHQIFANIADLHTDSSQLFAHIADVLPHSALPLQSHESGVLAQQPHVRGERRLSAAPGRGF